MMISRRATPTDGEALPADQETTVRKPITNMSEFRAQITDVNDRLKRYAQTKRRVLLSDDTVASLKQSSAMSLKATNALSRIVVASAADWKFRELLQSAEGPHRLHWITIEPAIWSRYLDATAIFQSHVVRGEVARILEGINYFGMIDIAFYPRIENGIIGSKNNRYHLSGPRLSFHVHLVAWGVSEAEITLRQDNFNARYSSLFPNRLAFFSREISQKQAREKNFYQLKPPVSAYTASTYLRDQVDWETGEISLRPVGKWKTGKRPIKTGEAAKVHNAICHLSIPELMLGGGRGLKLKQDILLVATGRLRFHHASLPLITEYLLKQMRRRPSPLEPINR